ncbi:hypothetical protein GJAV_G00224040 [Gymnothorax javanicus]|nr:hypothetical protein GJAV_G00224040 [Gymnothorax javanicus]
MRISPLPSKGGGFYTADKHQQLHSMSNSVPSPSSSFSGEDAKSEPVMDSSVLTGVGTSSHLNGWEYLEGRETGYVMSREQNMLTNMKEEREDWEELNVKIENDDGVEDEEGFWKEEDSKRDETDKIITDHRFIEKEIKLECGQQEVEGPSMFSTLCVLKQPRVLIHRLEITKNSVAVQSLPSPLSCERSQGVRSLLKQHEVSPLVSDGFLKEKSQVLTLEREDAESEVPLNQLPSSSENETSAEASFTLVPSTKENTEGVHLQHDVEQTLPDQLNRTIRSQTPPSSPHQRMTPSTFPTPTESHKGSQGDHPQRKKMLRKQCTYQCSDWEGRLTEGYTSLYG